MDAIAGFLGYILKLTLFELLFFWPGWAILKILTLGKYPKLTQPGRSIKDYEDVQFVCYFGLFVTLPVFILAVKHWPF